jgi:hypothetical protein
VIEEIYLSLYSMNGTLMDISITDIVVDFLLNREHPPRNVRLKAVEHIQDGLAVMLAGSRNVCSKIFYDYVIEKKGVGESSLLGFEKKNQSY